MWAAWHPLSSPAAGAGPHAHSSCCSHTPFCSPHQLGALLPSVMQSTSSMSAGSTYTLKAASCAVCLLLIWRKCPPSRPACCSGAADGRGPCLWHVSLRVILSPLPQACSGHLAPRSPFIDFVTSVCCRLADAYKTGETDRLAKVDYRRFCQDMDTGEAWSQTPVKEVRLRQSACCMGGGSRGLPRQHRAACLSPLSENMKTGEGCVQGRWSTLAQALPSCQMLLVGLDILCGSAGAGVAQKARAMPGHIHMYSMGRPSAEARREGGRGWCLPVPLP